MTFPRTHSFQANLKPELFPQDPRFCPPSPSFPFPFSPYFSLPLDLSHAWKTYPCGYLSEFCTSYKAQLKCHLILKASQALDSKSLSPLSAEYPPMKMLSPAAIHQVSLRC